MTPEQKNLIEQANESLSAAKLLYREGYYGFAAARAYYTMFYIAEAFLLGRRKDVAGVDSLYLFVPRGFALLRFLGVLGLLLLLVRLGITLDQGRNLTVVAASRRQRNDAQHAEQRRQREHAQFRHAEKTL